MMEGWNSGIMGKEEDPERNGMLEGWKNGMMG
jgi:hypothetical protein